MPFDLLAKIQEHIGPTSLHFLWLLMEQRTRLLKVVIDDFMFLTKLCRNDTKPPFLQDRRCRRSIFSPHSQYAGRLVSVHPLRYRMRSQKSYFVRSYPSSNSRSVVSQTLTFSCDFDCSVFEDRECALFSFFFYN